MKVTARLLSLLLVLALVVTMLPTVVYAEENTEDFTYGEEEIPFQVNPLYEGIYEPAPEDVPQFPEQNPGNPRAVVYQTPENAAMIVRDCMKTRQEKFQVYVKSTDSNYRGMYQEILKMAVEHTGEADEGDYLMYHLAGHGARVGYKHSQGVYYYTLTIIMSYCSTVSEEEELDAAVDALLASLDVWDRSDYEKVCAVYDYMCDNITYDYANLWDYSYIRKFSAYAALVDETAVCQGYALLFYRLMLELGVDARFIGGDSNGPHAWNIVQVGDYYYNVDATRDAGRYSYANFLRSTWNFDNHYRDPEFDDWDFHMAHPMAGEDYTPGGTATLDQCIGKGCCGDIRWTVNRDGTLRLEGSGATRDHSDDEAPHWYRWLDHIERAEVGEGITALGDCCFYDVHTLKEVSLPESLTAIGASAFESCDLQTLTIPAAVSRIESCALADNEDLATLYFRGDAPEFDSDALRSVKATIYYPLGNDTWTEAVMGGCGSSARWEAYTPVCEEPKKCGDNACWTYENGTLTISGEGAMYDYCWDYLADENRPWADLLDQIHTVVVEDGITHIGEAAFFWMPNLTAVSLPDSVLTIGRDALAFNPSLEAITLPGNLREIYQTALQRTALKELTLPASLMFLDNICEGCTELKKVTILGDPELPGFVIANSVFRMCTALEEIQVVGEHFALCAVDNALYAANTLNDYALNNPARELVIRDGTERINQFAMQQAQNVEHIIIPASMNFVGMYAFAECHSLETVTFLGSAPEIQEDIFWNDTLTVRYPANDPTWTADVMQNYGGNVTWVGYVPECTDHSYEAVVTEPTCQGGGYTTYTCSKCGDSYVDDYTAPVKHVYENGPCKWCGIRWISGTTSLNGTIDLNIYVALSGELLHDPNAFIRFTHSGVTVDVPVSEGKQDVKNGIVCYRYSCEIFAKQVADTVTVQVMTENGPVGDALEYSVMKYCMNQINKSSDAELVAVCKGMLNYAAAAQTMFGYNTDNLANASLSEVDKVLQEVEASAYKYAITGSEDGIKASSATLMLESEVKIRVYFQLTGSKSIEEYTFTIDGKEVEVRQNAKGYYIETDGIAAKHLERMYEFCVGGITLRYSALSYVNSKVTSSKATEPEKNLARALYAYWQAAEAFLG